MLGKSDKLAKTGKLVVTIVAVAVDPTGITATAAGLDAFLHFHDTLTKAHPDLAKLASETQIAFDKALKTKHFDKPDNARQLLPQMLEQSLPTNAEFIEHGLDYTPILAAMVCRLKDPEHKRPEMIGAFETLYGPLLQQVCNDPRLKAALDPALTRDRVRREYRREGKLDEVLARLGGLEGAVADPNAASFDDLCALAAQFEETDFSDKAQVTKFLTLKAEEYLAYRVQIDRIDERTAGLGNLKAAAQDAAEALNFEEVETLLSRVHEVELEIAAETAELRAGNALLRGRHQQAYQIISSAADGYAAIDAMEPARKKILKYAEFFGRHGMRYGGHGLALSVTLMRETATEALQLEDPLLWAAAKNAEAIGLQIQGARTGGETGAALLAEAVTAYRAALTVRTRADHPVDWALTQNNLGLALQIQGTRTGGKSGAALLAEAVAAHCAVLTVFTQADHPVQWAMTQNNLGIVLREQSTLIGGEDGAALLGQAVAAYRAALTVLTQADHPLDWASTQNNLGIALQTQGTRTGGEDGAALLAEAVTAYRAALTVRTRADHPVDWAATQNNLGLALQNQGTRTGGEDGAALLAEAVTAYRAALTVYTQADHPVDGAMTQENLAIAERAIADHAATTAPRPHLQAALTHIEAALTVFDPDHMPYNHDKATTLRDHLRARLAASD